MNENRFLEFLMGIAMMVTGVILLLMNITVQTFGFYRFGNFDTAPVLIILLVILIIWAVASKKTYPWNFVGLDILCIIISVLVGTRFVFKHINLFTLIVMLGMFAVGAGLFLRNLIYYKKHKDEWKKIF